MCAVSLRQNPATWSIAKQHSRLARNAADTLLNEGKSGSGGDLILSKYSDIRSL